MWQETSFWILVKSWDDKLVFCQGPGENLFLVTGEV